MRISDWSSDVCSSDLHLGHLLIFGDAAAVGHGGAAGGADFLDDLQSGVRMAGAVARSAEVVDDHFRAAPCEFEGIGTAEAAAGAGDNVHAAADRKSDSEGKRGHGRVHRGGPQHKKKK